MHPQRIAGQAPSHVSIETPDAQVGDSFTKFSTTLLPCSRSERSMYWALLYSPARNTEAEGVDIMNPVSNLYEFSAGAMAGIDF